MRRSLSKLVSQFSRTSYRVAYLSFYLCGLFYTGMIIATNLKFYFKYSSNISQREFEDDPDRVSKLCTYKLTNLVNWVSERSNMCRFYSLQGQAKKKISRSKRFNDSTTLRFTHKSHQTVDVGD